MNDINALESAPSASARSAGTTDAAKMWARHTMNMVVSCDVGDA